MDEAANETQIRMAEAEIAYICITAETHQTICLPVLLDHLASRVLVRQHRPAEVACHRAVPLLNLHCTTVKGSHGMAEDRGSWCVYSHSRRMFSS